MQWITKKVANGEMRVSKGTWDAIDPSLRGLPRHYRRERPRLAALEVWSRGENIALGLKERKGIALDYAGKSVFGLLDGDFNTLQNVSSAVLPRTIYLDMKSTFWIDTFITFYKESHSVFANFEIQTRTGNQLSEEYHYFNQRFALAAAKRTPGTRTGRFNRSAIQHHPLHLGGGIPGFSGTVLDARILAASGCGRCHRTGTGPGHDIAGHPERPKRAQHGRNAPPAIHPQRRWYQR